MSPERNVYARCFDHDIIKKIFSGVLKYDDSGFYFNSHSPLIQNSLLPHHRKYTSHDHGHYGLFDSRENAINATLEQEVPPVFSDQIGFLVISTKNFPVGYIETK